MRCTKYPNSGERFLAARAETFYPEGCSSGNYRNENGLKTRKTETTEKEEIDA
jgi:hypothetical protein